MAEKGLTTLGLDMGSNSVGSAWVDTRRREIHLAVSVFPAGVEEGEDKRGAPKNQKRRERRGQRRSIARRAGRKRQLRRLLAQVGLLPAEGQAWDHALDKKGKEPRQSPWELRREGLNRPLTPHEFGRVLRHLNQRRGALGIRADSEDEEQAEGGKGRKRNSKDDEQDEAAKAEHAVKEAIDATRKALGGRTFGQMIADLHDQRKSPVPGKKGKFFHAAVRNRRDAFEFHGDRHVIREEFDRLWETQRSFGGKLADLLTDDLKRQLDNPAENDRWRHQGILFGQRRTYWRLGTLGQCDLEPTDRRCPLADRHAQEYRVVETVNNIRIQKAGEEERPLTEVQRANVVRALRAKKTGSVATVRTALAINKKGVKEFYSLNLERDPDRKINTDWFYCEIVHGAFGQDAWEKMSQQQRESVNRAVLKFDPDKQEHAARLGQGAVKWWGLCEEAAEKLIDAWKKRPLLENRLNLSRRAIENLLPYMNRPDPETGRWPTVNEARQQFALDEHNGATLQQRARYAFHVTDELKALLAGLAGPEQAKALLRLRGTRKADRHYLKKHGALLPPAPFLPNPVVRKAIHEARRHVLAYVRKFQRKPDRIVIEMAREARQSAKVRNAILARNRKRENVRKQIIEQHKLGGSPLSRQRDAVDRVLLCRQQRFACAYTGETITEETAAAGTGVEVDHIVPKSVGGPNTPNNKVLCLLNANRSKGSRTPRDWLPKAAFEELLQRFAHLKDRPPQGDFFSKKDFGRKWENLNRRTPTLDEFLESQLTDTAYAARRVTQWLRDVLYEGETGGCKHVFTTSGGYTAVLRKDWQLQDQEGPKPRTDHRHHAIDAVAIALSGPEVVKRLADQSAEQEALKVKVGQGGNREPIRPPWGSVGKFRAQVMDAVEGLIVCHRPVKRKIVGALHLETAYGEAEEYPGLYSFRAPVRSLKPSSLRAPKKTIRKGKEVWSIEGRGQGSVVRDSGLRDAIRACLLANGKAPDSFTDKDVKELRDPQDYKLRLPSGVPIYSVTMVRTLTEPVVIKGRDGVTRFFVGGNNHHVEILEDEKTGMWSGKCWNMYDVARRVRPRKRQPNPGRELPMVIGRELDRLREEGCLPDEIGKHYEGKRFVMSLSEGEIVRMKSPPMTRTKVADVDYYVVVKLHGNKVFFVHHADARPAAERTNPRTGEKEPAREMFHLRVGAMKDAGPEPGTPPQKVRLDPLQPPRPLPRD